MKQRMIVVLGVSTFLFLLPVAPAARAQVKTVEIPFSLSGGLMIVQANINGRNASLLFDSGAMRTFVNPAILEGLTTSAEKAISIADGNRVDVRVVKTVVSLGGASVEVPVSSYDMTKFAASIGLRLDGVVGQDVIGKFSGILIDYVRHRITLIE
jgi:Aspartyl protease